jgi:hypothetical protein
MNALAYRARLNRIDLRLVAYRPAHEPMPDDHLRLVVQVVERGRPIAEDPLLTQEVSTLDLAWFIHNSRMEGWDIQPWERSH